MYSTTRSSNHLREVSEELELKTARMDSRICRSRWAITDSAGGAVPRMTNRKRKLLKAFRLQQLIGIANRCKIAGFFQLHAQIIGVLKRALE